MEKNVNFNLKAVLVGDANVGKTSLLRQYTSNIFEKNYSMTVGVDFCFKNLKHKNNDIKIQIWDTAG